MKNYASIGLVKLNAICLVFAILMSSSMFVLAAPGVKTISAEIIVSGTNDNGQPAVLLNGEEASSGRTFQTTGVVTTSTHGSAIINLGKLGRINLLPGSTLSVTVTENNISGELTAGHMSVANAEGVSVNIKTADDSVTNDASKSGNMSIDVTSGITKAQAKDDDDDDDNKAWVPILIFAGAVGAAAIIVITRNGDEDVISPVR
jgi:hypothetical protein